jgi:hypothetical protein
MGSCTHLLDTVRREKAFGERPSDVAILENELIALEARVLSIPRDLEQPGSACEIFKAATRALSPNKKHRHARNIKTGRRVRTRNDEERSRGNRAAACRRLDHHRPRWRHSRQSTFLGVIRSGSLSHEVMDSRDVRVRIYGNSAAVTALTTTTGKFTGQAFNTEERATDLWVKKNGRWMCVLSQLTRFTKK